MIIAKINLKNLFLCVFFYAFLFLGWPSLFLNQPYKFISLLLVFINKQLLCLPYFVWFECYNNLLTAYYFPYEKMNILEFRELRVFFFFFSLSLSHTHVHTHTKQTNRKSVKIWLKPKYCTLTPILVFWISLPVIRNWSLIYEVYRNIN